MRRCFVALDLPEQAREAAYDLQRGFREKFPDLRYTCRENLHLTLKFLGEMSSDSLEAVCGRLQSIRSSSFETCLGSAGVFAPGILWLRLQGANNFQRQVDAALAPLFEPEARFMGHVTIARTKAIPDSLHDALEAQEATSLGSTAESCSLQESFLSHEGQRYETIERYQLEG